jgi:hypothetical protein
MRPRDLSAAAGDGEAIGGELRFDIVNAVKRAAQLVQQHRLAGIKHISARNLLESLFPRALSPFGVRGGLGCVIPSLIDEIACLSISFGFAIVLSSNNFGQCRFA